MPLLSIQNNYVKFVLGLPEKRKFRLLKRNGLLAHPLVQATFHPKYTKEDFLIYLNKIEETLPSGNFSRKLHTAYESYTTFYRAIQFYWKGYNRPFQFNEILQMRWNFIQNPIKFSQALKDLFNNLRASAFGLVRPDNLLDYYFSGAVSVENKFQASACIRSLPQFAGSVQPHLDECVKRWTTKPADIDTKEWKEWITDWVKFNRPARSPDSFPISLGTGATLEYPRSQQGFKQAVLKLLTLPLSKKRDAEFEKELNKIKFKLLLDREGLLPYRRNNYLIYACLTALEPAIQHSKVCEYPCKSRALHPPMCILALRERGFKVRLPTMTIAPIVYLAKLMRQVADSYLRSDPRIRNSLEGNFLNSLDFRGSDDFYRSQDLTVATDHHSREVNRIFYNFKYLIIKIKFIFFSLLKWFWGFYFFFFIYFLFTYFA
jgi:hypothetical protein